jgi:hypothetical protein
VNSPEPFYRQGVPSLLPAILFLLLTATPADAADEPDIVTAKTPPEWLKQVNVGPAGDFPLPRPFQATYRIAWSDLTAARVEVDCTLPPDNGEIQTRLKASTVGAARALWQMDATHLAIADRRTLRPIRLEQNDKRSKKQMVSKVDFTPQEAVRRSRTITKEDSSASPPPLKAKHFVFPAMLDMQTAFLYLRSQPLANGDSHTLVVMNATNPYLATVKVVGRETVKTSAGRFPAMKCSLALNKIDNAGQIKPHKSFKGAHIWVADNDDRTLLKIEAQVFIGSVMLELEKLSFPAAGKAR